MINGKICRKREYEDGKHVHQANFLTGTMEYRGCEDGSDGGVALK